MRVAVANLMKGLLFGVGAGDPVTYVLVSSLLIPRHAEAEHRSIDVRRPSSTGDDVRSKGAATPAGLSTRTHLVGPDGKRTNDREPRWPGEGLQCVSHQLSSRGSRRRDHVTTPLDLPRAREQKRSPTSFLGFRVPAHRDPSHSDRSGRQVRQAGD